MRKIYILLGFLVITVRTVLCQEIITTTSVLSSAVKEIVKDKFIVETLVPSGYCPGHFDIKGSHLASIEKSGLLFAQGFEPYLEQIKNSIKNKNFSPVFIKTEGTWFSNENQQKIYIAITEVLSEKFPRYRSFFESNCRKTLREIENTDRTIKNMVKKQQLTGKPVICNGHLKDMLEYIGFKVVVTYGRKEEITPADIKNLINTGVKENVILVIDNLQAGPDTGKVIADELKVPHITISNFPEGIPETPTLRETLYKNTERIIKAYGEGKNQVR
ncbi:MAG TPA: metal ABC transporter substrate-binding protein [bacterium]|nr:metal ABC transporter substrate-binding protein [bacterium]HPP29772.1 metal ABC transporter substrate-binding protein [bacterium]